MIGYYTKWGDGATDFLPIGDLYKSQIFTLGKLLEIPSEILNRKPTAELWPGQTDEEDLGFNYSDFFLSRSPDPLKMRKASLSAP